MRSRHTIWLMAYDGMQALDLTGPHEVFATANKVAAGFDLDSIRYDLQVVTPTGDAVVTTESGLRLAAEPWPGDVRPTGGRLPDTLLVPGGDAARYVGLQHPVVSRVREIGDRVDRLACVCTGAFIAARAGLLDGRRVATHWARVEHLAAEFPSMTVDPDAIHLVDDGIWTSAGVTAGIDLALALVDHDLGSDVAQEVARWLVVFVRRAGGQSQFAPPVWSPRAEEGPVRQAQDLIDADPAAVTSVAALASIVGLSTRHFTRRFVAEVGESPARYIERVRLTAARQHLELGDDGLAVVARRCGFGTSETLRRVFHRRLGVSPEAYRNNFAAGQFAANP